MNLDRPDDEMPVELLAAYADGELDVAGCARVEAWLVEHPEAQTDLFEQRELCRSNSEFWDAVEPPMPSPEQWDVAFRRIENRLAPSPMPVRSRRRTAWYLAPALALAGLAAALLVVVIGNTPNQVRNGNGSSVAAPNTIEDDEDGVYRVATADDVELIQLPEEASSLIVVGRHPMADTPLVLATTTDVDIFNLGPDDQGRMPHVEMIAGPNTPMVVVQSPRR